MKRRLGAKFLLLGFGAGLAIVLLEIGLRLFAPTSDQFYVWPPYLRQIVRPSETHFPGVSGPSEFRVSSIGLRGDELSDEDEIRILAIGGSTTECLILDQRETWPQLVQEELAAVRGERVWVGNAGRSGHSTREHSFQVPRLLAAVPRVDFVLLLAGANDLGLRLKRDQDYDPEYLTREHAAEHLIPRAFSICPIDYGIGLPFYKRTELYARARLISYSLRSGSRGVEQGNAGAAIARWRSNRENASRMRTELPDLSGAIEEYTRNLERIADHADEAGVKLVLLTQPAIWHDALPVEERARLWWGGVGDFQAPRARVDFYSEGVMAAGIERYNASVREICDRRGIPLIDLARRLPKDGSVFYDDMHFTEAGADRVARIVATALSELLDAG